MKDHLLPDRNEVNDVENENTNVDYIPPHHHQPPVVLSSLDASACQPIHFITQTSQSISKTADQDHMFSQPDLLSTNEINFSSSPTTAAASITMPISILQHPSITAQYSTVEPVPELSQQNQTWTFVVNDNPIVSHFPEQDINPSKTVIFGNDLLTDNNADIFSKNHFIHTTASTTVPKNRKENFKENMDNLLSQENLQSLIPHVIETSAFLTKFGDLENNSSEKKVSNNTCASQNSTEDKKDTDSKLNHEHIFEDIADSLDFITQKVDADDADNEMTNTDSMNLELNASKKEMEEFSKLFKQKRIRLGFTQNDVGLALGSMYGNLFSQTTVCRFEALTLTYKNMCKLRPLLSKWLDEIERDIFGLGCSSTDEATLPLKKRRKRTSLDLPLKGMLEAYFSTKQKPNGQEITHIANQLNLEKDVVRVWFCNRRQKQKKNSSSSLSTSFILNGENNNLVFNPHVTPLNFIQEIPQHFYVADAKPLSPTEKKIES